jgi:selenide,water dikinase
MSPVTRSMTMLNKIAAEAMIDLRAHACTDVTGFGLIGHASHLVQEGDLGIEFDFKKVPVFPEVMDLLKNKIYPGGLGRNREFYSPLIIVKSSIARYQRDILFDPQTSGGLLISLPPDASEILVEKLHRAGITSAVVIGRVIRQPEHKIIVS